jgi:hypothetical protein
MSLRKQGASKGATVSFEMRPYEGMGAEESLKRFVEVFERAKEV